MAPKLDPEFTQITRDGRPCWLHVASGRVLPIVAGGQDDDEDLDPDDKPDDGKKFSQADLDRIAARSRAEAKKAAERDVKAFLEAEKAKADEASLDEVARAKAEADREKAEAEADRAAARRERLDAKVERRLLAAGLVTGDDTDKALTRATRLVTLDDDADDDAITAEIDALKADMPGLFAEATDDDGKGKEPKPPSGVTGKPPAGGQPGKSAKDVALAELRRRGHVQPATTNAA